ncbi:MAG: amidohydrolase family protein, partial [Chloroflexi bacterium]|nr:amidohydrolase family protein [Chloroflexota bacterium]
MRWYSRLAAVLCGVWLGILPAEAQAPVNNGANNGKLAIVGGYLIDGNEGTPIQNSVVLVEGDRVVHVGTVADTPIPGDTKVISAEGYTIMPGLHDAHVHLMIVGHGVYSEWFVKYDSRMREIMPISARHLLMAGVTSARDLGAPLEDIMWLKKEIESGRLVGPRLFVSGPFLQKTSSDDQKFFRWLIDGPADARAKTRRLIDAGVDLIKVTQSDRLSREELRAIREEAGRAGLHIAAHGYTHEELRAAIEDLGARTIEHVNARPHPFYPEESVRLMGDHGVYAVPTSIVSLAYDATEAFPERLDDQRLKRDLPPEVYQ